MCRILPLSPMPTAKKPTKKPAMKKTLARNTTVKKAVLRKVSAPPTPSPAKGKPIGKVSHYYDKIGVAIVDLKAPLKKGDSVKFMRGDQEFEQMVESMQFDHQDIAAAAKGKSIGLKVAQKVKEGALVFKA